MGDRISSIRFRFWVEAKDGFEECDKMSTQCQAKILFVAFCFEGFLFFSVNIASYESGSKDDILLKTRYQC